MIRKGDYKRGDRLPPIMEMAGALGGIRRSANAQEVGRMASSRSAWLRRGYVSRSEEVLVLASPTSLLR